MPSSNHLRQKIADLAFRAQPFAPPAIVYVSLHTADPTASALPATEATGAWYARQPITFGPQSVSGQVSNSNKVDFPAVSGSPITITHYAIWDAANVGNMLAYASLSAQKVYSANDIASFTPGQVVITIT